MLRTGIQVGWMGALLCLVFARPLWSQNKLEFTVASIHENKSSDKPDSNFPLDRSNAYAATGGVFRATNQTLVGYIMFAYKMGVSESAGGFIRSLPEWATEARFDITAKSDSPNPSKDDMRSMLRSLLEQRFKVVTHRETRSVPVFALSLESPGKIGPQLRPHDPASPCPSLSSTPPRSMTASQALGTWPHNCGDGQELRMAQRAVRDGGRDMTMAAIASWLTGASDWADRPVIDATGLSGTYDFVLDSAPNYDGPANPDSAAANALPELPEALRQQLGLRLRKQQGSVTFFLVDHIERPSPN